MWSFTKFIFLACAIGPNLASETDITEHCNQNDPIAQPEQAASIVQQGPPPDASIAMASEEEDSDDSTAAKAQVKGSPPQKQIAVVPLHALHRRAQQRGEVKRVLPGENSERWEVTRDLFCNATSPTWKQQLAAA
eukprot:CAMPEP_0172851718 /NCGR_PEP_ID=MMETSP1075-20121228/51807_1 /TAXON_ID=2916 /ORGANISM="Ceratium fusus, Strain PA161109" /LENGTH=134 /DNA_ID=CAMNT_0013697781 /DNA_START=99 /DNA_END=501 /DNA_ORIENTATION=+